MDDFRHPHTLHTASNSVKFSKWCSFESKSRDSSAKNEEATSIRLCMYTQKKQWFLILIQLTQRKIQTPMDRVASFLLCTLYMLCMLKVLIVAKNNLKGVVMLCMSKEAQNTL